MHLLNRYLDKELLQQAQLLHAVTLSIRTRLPHPAAEHCWAGSMRDDTLVIITDSGHWVVPIRYQQHELLKQLNSEFRFELRQTLKRMRIKVATPTGSVKKRTRKPTLSTQNAQLLASTASGITDPDLKAALQHLATRAKRTLKKTP